ncbi:MAG: T9SS type A sorting domain-containing protein [Chitinophagales bacterium]
MSACSCFLGTGYPKYRFVFKSDSIDNQRCGWSIFHITASVFYCDGIEEINSVRHFANVYPNPVSDISFFHLNDQNQQIEYIQFFNSIGVLMKTISDPGQNEIPVLKKDFSTGLSFFRVQLKDGKMDAGKFVVN